MDKPSQRYVDSAEEGLSLIEHSLHHLSKGAKHWTAGRAAARFVRARMRFQTAYKVDRDKADEAWDLLIGPLLSLIDTYGDGSAELAEHRDGLVALSEDFLGTHHNRDGFVPRDDNPRTPNFAGEGSAWVMAEIDPYVLRQAVGVRNASQAECEAVAKRLSDQFFDRDANWTMIAQAYNAIQDEREDNPRTGLSLGSVALGAAVGAAAMHFTMKRKP